MARVDLQCACGYKFFVADAQLKQRGGADCPACLSLVKPGSAAPAGKAPKAAPKAAAPEAEDDFQVVALPGGGSKTKLYAIAGGVGVVVVAAVVAVIMVVSKPSVDFEKQAQLEDEARKKRFEEISSKDQKTLPLPAVAEPGKKPAPVPPEKAPRSTEYRPIEAAKPPTTSQKTPVTPGKTPAETPPQAAPGSVSPDLVARVRTDLLALHPFYLGLVLSPAEKARVETLSSTGRGAPADADFVASVLSSAKLKAVADEIAHISQTLPTLERESSENLPVDKVTLIESGRVLHCKILDDGAEVVKVARLGIQMPIRKDAIQRTEKGKGIGTDFATRWESVQKGGVASQVELLGWCKENTLANQAKLVAYTILRSDPGHARARTEAGLPPDPIKHQEAVAAGGVISYQGKSWNAGELKEKFIKDGYCLLEGKWYSKKDKMITVPGLFRYERQNDKPVNFGGSAGLCHETETTYKQMLDAGTQNYVEQAETKLLRRFYAPPMTVVLTPTLPPGIVPPRSTYELDVRVHVDAGTPPPGTPMKGEVTIQVPVGVPILEAAVTTTAEVKAGASIVVYHVTGSGDNEKRTKLYMCDPKENEQHPIPTELVRGLSEVNLVAVIEEPATYIPKTERRRFRNAIMKGKIYVSPAVDILHYKQIPDYRAMLFPSNSNTIEVFRLKLAVAESAPMLDKLFTNSPEVLK